jgi:hypothetical protein
MTTDNSSVFHVSMLDADIQANHNSLTPWIFETDQGQWEFATEAEACAEQRAYREQTGHHPITGERVD